MDQPFLLNAPPSIFPPLSLLLLGTIPILSRRDNPLIGSGLLDGMPVLILNSWDELSPSRLANEHARITRDFGQAWPRHTLFAEHWVAAMFRWEAYGQAMLDEGRLRCARDAGTSWECHQPNNASSRGGGRGATPPKIQAVGGRRKSIVEAPY